MSGQSLKAAGVRTSGWLIPALVLCAALSQPGRHHLVPPRQESLALASCWHRGSRGS
jgi:hypothetical protein